MRAGSHRRSSACCIDAHMPARSTAVGVPHCRSRATTFSTALLQVCRVTEKRDGALMLECDACLRGFHTTCLRPRLPKNRVPEVGALLLSSQGGQGSSQCSQQPISSFMQTLCCAAQAFHDTITAAAQGACRKFPSASRFRVPTRLLCTTGRVAVPQLHSWGATTGVADTGRHDAAEAAGACRGPCRSAH